MTSGRRWDAASYDRVGGAMTAMATAVLDRLPLAGDEVVLDAGCGTGRVAELLLDRLPNGRVVAVDADPDMVRMAQDRLSGRAEVHRMDLDDLVLDTPVDAVFSTATFHWLLDHDRLFRRLFVVLRPGGRLVAQCGGRGNIAELRDVAANLVAEEPFAPWFEGWDPPWYYAGPEETAERLETAGFCQVRTWLEPWPVVPDDPEGYLRTIVLGPHVQRLPAQLGTEFVDRVIEALGRPLTVSYMRLNLDAHRPVDPDT